MDDIRDRSEIEPRRAYALNECCAYIPGHGGRRISYSAIYAWAKAGRLRAFRLGRSYMVWGADLLQVVPIPPEGIPPSGVQKRRAATSPSLAALHAEGIGT